jgi:hypothetical protein
MGNIHQFTRRPTQTRNAPLPASAEVIIFPGVRLERSDHPEDDCIIAGKTANRAIAQRAVCKED